MIKVLGKRCSYLQQAEDDLLHNTLAGTVFHCGNANFPPIREPNVPCADNPNRKRRYRCQIPSKF